MLNNTPTFQQFWNAYNYKRDKFRAKQAWDKMNDDDKRNAVSRIAAYREDCERRSIPMVYGVRYLRNRRWEDEFDTPPSNTVPTPAPKTEHEVKQKTEMEEW